MDNRLILTSHKSSSIGLAHVQKLFDDDKLLSSILLQRISDQESITEQQDKLIAIVRDTLLYPTTTIDMDYYGLIELILESIYQCNIDLRSVVMKRVVFCVEGAKLPGNLLW
jgi:hypothetical protein